MLVRAVARVLEDAAALFFDDYEATSTYPEDWTAWWRAGGDLDARPGCSSRIAAAS